RVPERPGTATQVLPADPDLQLIRGLHGIADGAQELPGKTRTGDVDPHRVRHVLHGQRVDAELGRDGEDHEREDRAPPPGGHAAVSCAARCTSQGFSCMLGRYRTSRQSEGTVQSQSYDAIVVGSGISGGWAAKELTEKGLRVLLLER